MLGHFCGLENVPVFFCVETQLGSGLVFVLIHYGHGTDLSDVDVLCEIVHIQHENNTPKL